MCGCGCVCVCFMKLWMYSWFTLVQQRFQLYHGSQLYWCRKPDYTWKKPPISNLSHNVVSGTLYHERDSNSVIFTDCTDSCKSNYHAVKTTTIPLILIKFKLTSVVLSNIPTENIWTESDDYWLNTRNRTSVIFIISTNWQTIKILVKK